MRHLHHFSNLCKSIRWIWQQRHNPKFRNNDQFTEQFELNEKSDYDIMDKKDNK